MNRVIFPVVLAHELRVGVEGAPVVFVVCQDLLDVCIVLPRSKLVHFHFFVRSPLLRLHLLNGLLIDQRKV